MLTKLAVILAGVWLILHAEARPTVILTLIFGILIAALPIVDEVRR